ncbi:CehA/McbA family metallohydrolase [Bradyrhizobium sp. USDA 336]|uniref:CehA/McbA family metallohydrolase n=1 Tax=Bradyrhizobium sp. USDA 336 TaxID=3156311 RepID=UPI003832EA5D
MTYNPFSLPGNFYRGNLHTHSTKSDGLRSPEQVAKAYKQAGYDFIALTDHFEARFDWPITDLGLHSDERFLVIQGAELHAPSNSLGELWHIVAVGLPLDFAATGKDETGQSLAQRAASTGAFIGIAHPSSSGLSMTDAREIDCAHAVEIYNHASHVSSDRGDGWYLCTGLLNEGRRVTAYAADDAHFKPRDHFGGWVEVRASDLSPESIVTALRAGHFYSTQGPRIHGLEITPDRLIVECSPCRRIIAAGRGAKAVVVPGDEITHAEIPLSGLKSPYIRLTFVDAAGSKAWGNPLWLS